MKYNHKAVEEKWQKIWEEEKCFVAQNGGDKEKYYLLMNNINKYLK